MIVRGLWVWGDPHRALVIVLGLEKILEGEEIGRYNERAACHEAGGETVVTARVKALHCKEGHDICHGHPGKAIGESLNSGHISRCCFLGSHC